MNIGIYIYPEAEVMDFSGPFEVFSTASRIADSGNTFNVFLVSEHCQPVPARGGFSVNPHYSIFNHPPIDVLIVVGGVHTQQVKNQTIIEWVKAVSQNTKITASVCTGAFILAEAGLLAGLSATTHWEDLADFKQDYTTVTVVESVRWVDAGKIVTSAGISAGIDMSLHLVSRLVNLQLAQITARQMDYDWRTTTL